MPGGITKLAQTAAATSSATPAATPIAASNLSKLWHAAVELALDNNENWDEYDPDHDGDTDPNWDDNINEPQGQQGAMPWGEEYAVRKSPNGQEFLWTSTPGGSAGILSYMKNDSPHTLELEWDSNAYGYGEVISSSDDADADAYYELDDEIGITDENLGELIDKITGNTGSGSIDTTAADPNKAADEPANNTQSQDISRLARLAGIAKQGYDKLSQLGNKANDATPSPAQSSSTPPQMSLPAPTKANTLEPNFDKTKEKVPVRKDKS